MAGINLSDGINGSATKKKASFDVGFAAAVCIMILVLCVWGGVRYFMFTTDKEVTSLESQITEATSDLQNEKVDRVLSFDTRRAGIALNLTENVDVAKRLTELESLIIPSIRLIDYQFDHNAGTSIISGITSDYKYLAQQLISLKKQPEYVSIRVDKITNTEEGDISFTLKSETLSQ
jgi:hypothetical protein